MRSMPVVRSTCGGGAAVNRYPENPLCSSSRWPWPRRGFPGRRSDRREAPFPAVTARSARILGSAWPVAKGIGVERRTPGQRIQDLQFQEPLHTSAALIRSPGTAASAAPGIRQSVCFCPFLPARFICSCRIAAAGGVLLAHPRDCEAM